MAQVIVCPANGDHAPSCICGGTGSITVLPATSEAATIIACRVCGDPDNGHKAMGNVTITDDGVYVPAQCQQCMTYGSPVLVEKLNRERCHCQGLGNVKVYEHDAAYLEGESSVEAAMNGERQRITDVAGYPCERCGAVPTEETLQRVRDLVAA